jgi:hypothetical protein
MQMGLTIGNFSATQEKMSKEPQPPLKWLFGILQLADIEDLI